MRTKTVFHPSEIAHLWAHVGAPGAPVFGRNASNNFSFQRNRLYSYTTCIASWEDVKGVRVFLLADRTWSVTTSKHQSRARQAVHGNGQVFTVANWQPRNYAEHKANVGAMVAHATEAVAKAGRARTYAESHMADARRWLAHASAYAARFGVRGTIPTPESLPAVVAEQTAKQREAERKLAQAQARLETAMRAALPQALAHWRATGDAPPPFKYNGKEYAWRARLHNGGALMRLSGEDVITSQGARVSADVVAQFAPLVLRAMQPENAGTRAGLIGRHLGPYAIREVTDETLTVGCHEFKRDEIDYIWGVIRAQKGAPAIAEWCENVRANGG